MTGDEPTKCPECETPLALGGTYCRQCGWDSELAGTEDAYLDGVDVPQGYSAEDEGPLPTNPPPTRSVKIVTWIVVVGLLGIFAFGIYASVKGR